MPRHFFIAGAQRSATTYLYRLLDQHPGIAMAHPVRPEPKYFIRPDSAANVQAYRDACFADAHPDAAWFGEKSTSYIEHPLAAERIASLIPDALVLFVLRDPVERAISNYHFSVMHGLETLPLADALAAEADRTSAPGVSVSPFAYVARGHYARQLDAWAQHFPSSRLHVWSTEQLVGTQRCLDEVFAALDLARMASLTGIDEAVNQSQHADEVSTELREWLRATFRESNQDLARRYGVDTGAWQ